MQSYTFHVTVLFVFACVIGLIFGSFLNVCIARLPHHASIATPRSHCNSCGHTIRWYDNIPILSYLILRGRCRDCHAHISLQYPLVELATGLWFAVSALHEASHYALHHAAGNPFALNDTTFVIDGISMATFGFLLIGLCVMDWQTNLLPDSFTFFGIFIGFLFVCMRSVFLAPGEEAVMLGDHQIHITAAGAGRSYGNMFFTGAEHLILGRLLAITLAFLLLYAIRALYKLLRKRQGMGLGDAKLLAMIAAFVGFTPAILALFVGVITASAYGVLLLLRGRAVSTTRLPFGSFLCFGGLFAALWSQPLIAWYTALLR